MKTLQQILALTLTVLLITSCTKSEDAPPPPADPAAEVAAMNAAVPETPEVTLGEDPAATPTGTEPEMAGDAGTPVPMNTPPPAPEPTSTPKPAQGPDVNKLPTAKAYAAVWKSKDKLKALEAFKKKNGLPLMTNKKIGKTSVMAEEGPCGEDYASFVGNSKMLTESVWEIDAKGKILRTWHPGTMEILGIEKNTLYRNAVFYESLGDFYPYREKRNMKTHTYKLAIGADSSIKLLPAGFKVKNRWSVIETKCPKGLKIKSDYKYCVKEKKTKRNFVLERPCT